jgi:cobyrinic acid a,c-diamide synthase
MLAGLTARRLKVQHFRARARPIGFEVVAPITGLPGRHLDAWLMPPDVCREVFARGSAQADLSIVEGTLDEIDVAPGECPYLRPGRLAPLVEALDLATIALIDCRGAAFHLPRVSETANAVLLDNLDDPATFQPLRQLVELTLKRPVIGALDALPSVRDILRQLPPDQRYPTELLDRLAASFLRFADLPALRRLATSRPFPVPPFEPRCRSRRRFRVAYAQDEVFGGYFPDTLETLETLGAELVEFSPLRDGELPPSVDLVMIGCGFPDRHAEALARNQCMIFALRAHVCQGARIYSEGGGTAYLARRMILGGRAVPGAGILPIDAVLRRNPSGPTPVTRTLLRDGWLGPSGTVVRGYRSGRWRLRPAPEPDDCPARSGPLTHQKDLYFRHHAVGSLIHLHLAALPEVVSAFVGPHWRSLTIPTAPSGGRARSRIDRS